MCRGGPWLKKGQVTSVQLYGCTFSRKCTLSLELFWAVIRGVHLCPDAAGAAVQSQGYDLCQVSL